MGSREKRAKYNIVAALLCQAVTLVCGLFIPRMMMVHFGSEGYGATASISQFLGYIALLDGGVSGVARAALYKPLAQNDMEAVSEVVSEVKNFFRIIAYVFIIYTAIIAVSFKYISSTELDWWFCFWLVIVMSISTFAQYFIGISYFVFLQAAQRSYITNMISISTIILNTVMVILLINCGANLITVKLVSSFVFVIKPVVLWLYVKSRYPLIKRTRKRTNRLTQKWVGLGQHLAYYLHSGTDIAVLTVFGNLTLVAIYSVYNMVTAHMQNLVSSAATGMEALFGDMIAKNEKEQLIKTFNYYDTLISSVALMLFSTAAVMFIPFVRIYTRNLTDADYVVPVFALLMVMSVLVYCVRIPYHEVVIAAGHFKETSWAAWGEAIINITISIVTVRFWGLVGVAVGTLIAVSFRFIYYTLYLTKNILKRPLWHTIRRELVNTVNFFTVYLMGTAVLKKISCDGYFEWVFVAAIVFALSVVITMLINLILYREDCRQVYINFIKKGD